MDLAVYPEYLQKTDEFVRVSAFHWAALHFHIAYIHVFICLRTNIYVEIILIFCAKSVKYKQGSREQGEDYANACWLFRSEANISYANWIKPCRIESCNEAYRRSGACSRYASIGISSCANIHGFQWHSWVCCFIAFVKGIWYQCVSLSAKITRSIGMS